VLIACPLSAALAQGPSQPSSQADYLRAESLVRSRQWDDGLTAIKQVLATEPHNLKALNLAGIACSAKGDPQQADRYFEQALKLNPRFVPALKNLAISEFNAKQYAASERHLLAAQQQLPNDPTISVYLGEIAYAQPKYSLAVERLNRAPQFVKQDPKLNALLAVSLLRSGQKQQALELLNHDESAQLDAQSQLQVGVALAEFECNEEALPYLTEAYKHSPDSYDIGFDLALSFVRAKHYADAIATIHELIGREHDSSELENLLAEAFAGNGEAANAQDAYRRAIAFDPSDENNYLDFASFCLNHRAFDEGLKVIAAGLHAHPDSARLIFLRGVLEATQDNFDLAENDFQQAALLNPQHDFGTVGLGALYLERGKSLEALRVTRAQLRQKPNDPNLLYLLGEGLISSGAAPGQPDFVEAQSALEKAVSLNPALCLPHVSLGSLYLREERYADAAAQFEAARAIDPTENSAYSHLAVAYRHLGEPEKAKEVLTSLRAMLEQQRSGGRTQAKPTPQKELQ
jgi:Flp pilus assembly protein TadD